jgi:hypothetical protein
MLSVDALDEVLAGVPFSIASEDALLEWILSLGDEYRPLVSRIEIRFLSADGLALLAEHFAFPPECVCCSILDRLLQLPRPIPPAIADMASIPVGWNSVIVPDFPTLFEDFKEKEFALLWRGSRDGFGASDFHSRCDRHPNTLTVILETTGNIFGGFTPVKWESLTTLPHEKADPSRTGFLFTLKNSHNFPPQRFGLNFGMEGLAIYCNCNDGPCLGDIFVYDNCNKRNDNFTHWFGIRYRNNTGFDRKEFFTGLGCFQVKEIEVFEIMI